MPIFDEDLYDAAGADASHECDACRGSGRCKATPSEMAADLVRDGFAIGITFCPVCLGAGRISDRIIEKYEFDRMEEIRHRFREDDECRDYEPEASDGE
jgi:hypothetical protein